jgi:hypothetical protein
MPLHGRRFGGGSATTTPTPPLGDGGSGSTGSGGTILANNATGRGSIKLASALILHSIEADKACRVIFYNTAAHALADRNRKIGTPPKKGAGVLAEFLFSAPNETITCEPEPALKNGDSPQTSLIYYSITNLSGGSTTVTLTLDYTPVS